MSYTLEILVKFCFVSGKCIYGFILCVFQVFCETKSGMTEPLGQGGSTRPQNFGRQMYLNQRRGGGRLCPHINTGPPDFQTFLSSY